MGAIIARAITLHARGEDSGCVVCHSYLIGKVRLALLAQQEKLMSSERRLRSRGRSQNDFGMDGDGLLIQQRRPVEQQTDRTGFGSGGRHRHKSLAVRGHVEQRRCHVQKVHLEERAQRLHLQGLPAQI